AIEQDAQCLEVIARKEIPKGGKFAILLPNADDPGKLDTLESFYWEHLPKDTLYPLKEMDMSAPASVEIIQRFTFMQPASVHGTDSLSTVEKRVARSFARSIWRQQ